MKIKLTIVMRTSESISVFVPTQRLQLLRRYESFNGRIFAAIPQNDQPSIISDQDIIWIPWLFEDRLHGAGIQFIILRYAKN